MRPDPIQSAWTPEYATKYHEANYGRNLSGFVMRKSHSLIERPFDSSTYFENVIEVGAGTGVHLGLVKHKFGRYCITDGNITMLEDLRQRGGDQFSNVVVSQQDALRLEFDDQTFDRLIACHVLEHIFPPQDALREWHRVLKKGGVLSIVLPCDPGLLWRFGRTLGPRRQGRANGLAYDYLMAREHVNSITNLIAMIRYYFDVREEHWWPTRVPLSDTNLIYGVTINV